MNPLVLGGGEAVVQGCEGAAQVDADERKGVHVR